MSGFQDGRELPWVERDSTIEERISDLEGRVTSLESSRAAQWERISALEAKLATSSPAEKVTK
jgi:BMFP domain-containing protein YqiC